MRPGSSPNTIAAPLRVPWLVTSRPGTGIALSTTARPSSRRWRRPSTSLALCSHPSRASTQSGAGGRPTADGIGAHTHRDTKVLWLVNTIDYKLCLPVLNLC
jgi:hypothetical protein